MIAVGDVVADGIFGAGFSGNPTLADDFHATAQMRSLLQRFAKSRFALIIAVNIRVIDGSHAQIQVLLNKADPLVHGHIPVHQTPVAHNKTREFRPLRGHSNTLNHNNVLNKKVC